MLQPANGGAHEAGRVVSREKFHRLCGVIPVALSLLGFAIVMAVVATGWERYDRDEGWAVHLFQLLIVLQIPLFAAFLATANWKRLMPLATTLAIQIGALALALGSVAWFRL